jgi:dTDP-glucose 4,6-dehydratase
MNNVLITGGCGFIGSNLIIHLLNNHVDMNIVNLDCLTYAADLKYLTGVSDHHNYWFVEGDIRDEQTVENIVQEYEIDSIIHLAAESHVDNSINNPSEFVSTNINGTMVLLEAFRKYCSGRFLYVSTDEIYGALGPTGVFTESSPLAPNSPYSASKAAAGLMVRSYHKTFKQNVVTTSCSNNYGRHQHREKLIPTVITTALNGEPIPVYGNGKNVRDWLHVDDHCRAIDLVFRYGNAGETYNIGGDNEVSNIDLVKKICGVLNRLEPADAPYENQILFVEDRKGHDFRYAVDATKIKTELNWCPSDNFDLLLEQTIKYYV